MTNKIIHPRPNRRRPWKNITVCVPLGALAAVKLEINKYKESFKRSIVEKEKP